MADTRKRIFTPEEKAEIINMSLEATSTKKILAKMACDAFVYYNNRLIDPIFDKEVIEARATATETLADHLLDAGEDCYTLIDAQVARMKSENIKSVLAYRKPQTYGNKIDLNVNHTVDISQALLAAEGRVIPLLQSRQHALPTTSDTSNASVIGDAVIDAEIVKEKATTIETSEAVDFLDLL